MKKLILTLIIALSFLRADLLSDKIQDLVGSDNYLRHKKLIDVLFQDKKIYVSNKILNLYQISNVLSNNGLLDLEFSKPQAMNIEFIINAHPRKSMKIINNALKSLGYYYYFTNTLSRISENDLDWVIKMQSEHMIDPKNLCTELTKDNIDVVDIVRNKYNQWTYTVDTSKAIISQAIIVDSGDKVVLQKPLNPYFLKITGGSSLDIINANLNHWHPYVVFYNNNLQVLKTVERNIVYKELELRIPENTKYIKVSDLYTLINIKRGLSVIIKD